MPRNGAADYCRPAHRNEELRCSKVALAFAVELVECLNLDWRGDGKKKKKKKKKKKNFGDILYFGRSLPVISS